MMITNHLKKHLKDTVLIIFIMFIEKKNLTIDILTVKKIKEDS